MGKLIERMASECRFFANTLKEAMVHPMATSVIDKRTGRVVLRDGKRIPEKRGERRR